MIFVVAPTSAAASSGESETFELTCQQTKTILQHSTAT
jgi:hypothetical protein